MITGQSPGETFPSTQPWPPQAPPGPGRWGKQESHPPSQHQEAPAAKIGKHTLFCYTCNTCCTDPPPMVEEACWLVSICWRWLLARRLDSVWLFAARALWLWQTFLMYTTGGHKVKRVIPVVISHCGVPPPSQTTQLKSLQQLKP